MTTWDEIGRFYETTSQLSREGEMWEKVRYHCERMKSFVPEIQKHSGLNELEHSVSVFELRLVNRASGRAALILVEEDDRVRVNFYEVGKLKDKETHHTVRGSFDHIIKVLKTNLGDP